MRDVDEAQLAAALDRIYDTAVQPSPDAWQGVLGQLGGLFNSHFADLYARTDDWTEMRGRPWGMTVPDYEVEFLDRWCRRNVWSQKKPVRMAGEVLPTWKMVTRRELESSPIFNEFLRERALEEGLRLALWAGGGWILDISLLRSRAAGPFAPGELALGRFLLPHLQRAAATARRMGGVLGFAELLRSDRAAFLLDGQGTVLQHNAAAEALLAAPGGVRVVGGQLSAALPVHAAELAAAVAGAARIAMPQARQVRLGDRGATVLDVLPLREQPGWSVPGPRCVLAVAVPGAGNTALLMNRYGLTDAEATLALSLAAGQSVAEIAAATGRSINTARTHLARVMAKTRTQRQSQLVPLLLHTLRGFPG